MKNLSIALSLLTSTLVGCMGDDLQPEPQPQPDPVPLFAKSCAEIAKDATAADGEHTLYLHGDQTKPWKAYCVDLATAPKEYLTLASGGPGTWSMYRAGGAASGTDVETRFDKLRIDPETLAIDIGDETFAVSTGAIVDANGIAVTSMPLGVAMSCGGGYASAQIDVTGTPFLLTDHFALGGDAVTAAGHAGLWPDGQVVEIWADGICGWIAPANAPASPLNTAGGYVVQLTYKI